MKFRLCSFLLITQLFCHLLWAGATPALAAAPHQSTNAILEPVVVDHCPNFSAFDAAAILQEPVNSDEPIDNLIFGPLDEETLALATDGGIQGFCGYTSTSPATQDDVDRSQTHLLTPIDADYAVVAEHLTIDFASNTFPREWVDLYALVAVVGAANPDHDSEAILNALYNAAGYTPFPEALYAVAEGAPSFKAEWLEVGENQPYEEVLWLWQSVDDGYFSLLIARTGNDFDLVAARLGNQVNEQRVQGYSLVILDQIAAGDGTDQETTTNETAGETAESEPAGLNCALLSDDDAAILVGETALAYPVADEMSYGCKYLPESTTDASTADDGSPQFLDMGTLVMVLSNDFALGAFQGMAQGVEAAGATEGEIEAMQAAAQDGDLVAALQALAQIDLQTEMLHITALPEVSDDAVWVRFTERGEKGAIFLRSLPDGQMLQIMVIRPDLAEEEASTIEEIETAIGDVGVRALTDFAQALAASPSEDSATTLIDLRTFPAPESSEPINESSIGQASYSVPEKLTAVVEFYRTALSEQGWQEDESVSYAGEESATLFFQQAGYTLGLSLWPEDATHTHVDLLNYGNLDLATLPVTEDAEFLYQGPHTQIYATELAMDEAADYMRNAFAAEGWQETTDENALSINDENFQTYTFVQNGIQLMVVQTKTDQVMVTYNVLLLAYAESAVTENGETTAEASSTEEQSIEEPANQEDATESLTVEEKDGLPLPSDYTSYSSEGSQFRRVIEATSPSSLPILVEFFSAELPTVGWQSVEETTVSAESETFTALYEGAAGTLQLTLAVGDEETLIQIATKDSAAAEEKGILPAQGKGRVYFVNAGEQEITLTIGKETLTLPPGAGAESPTDAPHLDLTPKTYQVTIRLGDGKTAGEEVVSEVTLADGEVWVVASDGEFEFVSQVY